MKMPESIRSQHLGLLGGRRVVEDVLEHEAVHLRLGQRVGALLLDGVLGGEDEERVGQRVALAADRGLPLLHRLEHRRLGLGAGAVDLVEQHEVGVHRPELGRRTRAVCWS